MQGRTQPSPRECGAYNVILRVPLSSRLGPCHGFRRTLPPLSGCSQPRSSDSRVPADTYWRTADRQSWVLCGKRACYHDKTHRQTLQFAMMAEQHVRNNNALLESSGGVPATETSGYAINAAVSAVLSAGDSHAECDVAS